MAYDALVMAHRLMPKLTKASYAGLQPTWGPNYIGLTWRQDYVWYQERGIRSFPMKSLAGKTIPMWISDPNGEMRRKNPKAKTRVTAAGVTQVLIFRKAAHIGQNKSPNGRWKKDRGPQFHPTSPAHEPGQPGRIERRKTRLTNQHIPGRGKLGPVGRPVYKSTGQIAKGNVNKWWVHPGLTPRYFMNTSLTRTCNSNQVRIMRMVAD
jgi:hypothetical protein